MIHGVGIDAVEVSRFAAAMRRWGVRFCERLFTASELSYCLGMKRPEVHLSARFAAKVSVLKALGRPMRFRDIEITRDASGAPGVRAKGAEGMRISVSIAHDGDLSIAEAFVEKVP